MTEQNKTVRILAIESSCDETAAAVVENGRKVLSSVIYSQIATHTLYGGVVPEIASRKHIEKISQVVECALSEAGMKLRDVDAVGVTYGPGLVGPLLIGVSAAKAMAWAADKPLVGVNHIEGHVAANFIEYPDLEPPFMCLIVSGGHTHLVVVEDYGRFRILGRTELWTLFPIFLVEHTDKWAEDFKAIDSLLRALLADFPLHRISHIGSTAIEGIWAKDIVDVLVEHTVDAAREFGFKQVAMAGGVASNSALRAAMKKACDKKGISLYYPSPVLCTDNAAMIGSAAYYELIRGNVSGLDLNAVPGLKLGER